MVTNEQQNESLNCCGGPAPEGSKACCADDEKVKSTNDGQDCCEKTVISNEQQSKRISCC